MASLKTYFGVLRSNEDLSYGGLRTLKIMEDMVDSLQNENIKHGEDLTSYRDFLTEQSIIIDSLKAEISLLKDREKSDCDHNITEMKQVICTCCNECGEILESDV